MKPVVLCILDGVGIRKEIHGNAVKQANMPTFNMLMKKFPNSLLEASGEAVGLPKGQMGNSEVGHSNIGAGRIVYQPLEIINNAIKDESFFSNEKILEVINHTKQNNSKLHICGLLSDGGIHSHIDHLMNIIDICKKNEVKELYFHIFLDGRDTARDVAVTFINKLQDKIKEVNLGTISTISGRYYAMDRDNRWERIKLAYDAIVFGNGRVSDNIELTIKENYDKQIYDEFIEPFIVDEKGTINSNDGIIVFNYRPDRLRELFFAITNNKFKEFETKELNNIKLVTMFPVSKDVICTNAFEHQNLENTLGTYVAKYNKKQLRIAETEKYAHVTYFFDGGKEIDIDGKDKILIQSPSVATYDLKPEMSAYEITDKLIEELDKYDLIILNYANGDMVGHTGNMEATIKALESIDKCLAKLYEKIKELNGLLIVTADHGNSDYMLDDNDNPVTTHSTSKVPFIVTDNKYKLSNGKLSDIAPTILNLMDLDKPIEMTGNSLLIEQKETKIEKIFIAISIMILMLIFGTYLYRFVKYYKEENPKVTEKVEDTSLVTKLINNGVVTEGDGLYSSGNEYIYEGKVENNYVMYSGMLFRIVKINSDKTIRLITDDNVTSMVWGTDNYETSYIRDYLNDNGLENTGIFYNNLNNPDNYLVASNFCVDKIDKIANLCSNVLKDKVGLLSYEEYVEAKGNKSYLNINKYFWLTNPSDNGVWYVFNEGGINNNSHNEDTYYSYGVRPVINLKINTEYVSGDGTINNPYIIDNNNTIKSGDYVSYSDYLWKVINVDDEKIKLATTDYISSYGEYISKNFSDKSNEYIVKDTTSLAYYLNNNFYNSLTNKNIILDGTWYAGAYNEDTKYDYKEIYKSSVTAKVGLLNITDLFINDLNGYSLITKASEDMIYSTNEDGSLTTSLIDDELKVRPAIYISKNNSFTGDGTKENPYIIGDTNEE